MKARTYVQGQPIPIEVNQPAGTAGTAVLEVELDDGRTVQLSVDEAGVILLRGWGNIPATVGNGNTVELTCQVNPQKQTHCPICYNPFGPKDRCCGKMRKY